MEYVPPIFGGPNALGGIPDPNLENVYRWLSRNAPASRTVYLVGGEQPRAQGGATITTLAGLAGLGLLAWLVAGRAKQKRESHAN